MAYGFIAYGDAGNPQISSEAKTLFLREKGTFSTASNSTAGPINTRRSSLSIAQGTFPLLACRPQAAGNTMSVIYKTLSNGQMLHEIFSIGDINIDYWVFDALQSTPSDTYGLAVWNGSGQLTFHSGAHPMKIVGVGDGSYVEPSGKTYAIIQGSLAGQKTWIDDPQHGVGSGYYLQRMSWKGAHNSTGASPATLTTAGGILDGTTASEQHTSAPSSVNYGPANFLVVDVTNL